ncbi:MAG: hypothetical protein ACLQM6_06190 [Acidobacteriaceae bacterium]|jgi:hypothetical protein
MIKKKNVGNSFDDWLREEGLYEETAAVAVKRVLERQADGLTTGVEAPESDEAFTARPKRLTKKCR